MDQQGINDSGVHFSDDEVNHDVEISFHELVECGHLLTAHHEQIGQAVSHYGSLCTTAGIIDPAVQMSEPVMEALEVSVKHLVRSLGGDASRVSMEHRQTYSVTSSVIALESITETLKNLWEKIVNAFKAAVAWLKEFFSKLFNVCKQIKARAERLKKVVEARKDYVVNLHGLIDKASVISFLDENMTEPRDVLEGYTNYAKTAEAIQLCMRRYSDGAAKGLDALFAEYTKTADASPDEAVQKFKEMYMGKIFPMFADPNFYSGIPAAHPAAKESTYPQLQVDNTLLWEKDLPFAAGVFYGRVLKPGISQADANKAAPHCYFGVKYSKTDRNDNVKPLNRGDCLTILDDIIKRMDKVLDNRKETQAITSELNKVLSTVTKVGVNVGYEPFRQTVLMAITHVAHLLIQANTVGERELRMYDVHCAKHLLDYVALSIKVLPKE